jgi:hypothetical protein
MSGLPALVLASRDPRRGISLTRQQGAEAAVIAALNALPGTGSPGVVAARRAAVRLIDGCMAIADLPGPRRRLPPPASVLSPPRRSLGPAVPQPGCYTQDMWQLILSGFSLRELSGSCALVCRAWRDAAHGVASGWGRINAHEVCGGGHEAAEMMRDPRRLRYLGCWIGGSAQTLNLSSTDISDIGLRSLVLGRGGGRGTASPTLRHLDITFCTQLSDLCVPTLCAAPLQSCRMDGVHRISNRGLLHIASVLGPSLRELRIDGESVDDRTFVAMMAALPRLGALGVSFCEQLSDSALESLHGRVFSSLSLRKSQFSDGAMGRLLDSVAAAAAAAGGGGGGGAAGGLKALDLSEGQSLSTLTGEAIGRCCPGVECLTLNWCWQMKDAAVAPIVRRCGGSSLRELRLVGLKELTTAVLLPLGGSAISAGVGGGGSGEGGHGGSSSALVLLDVSQCDYCEDEPLLELAARCPQLVIRTALPQHTTSYQSAQVPGWD